MKRQTILWYATILLVFFAVALFAGLPVLGKYWVSAQGQKIQVQLYSILQEKPGHVSIGLVAMTFCAVAMSGVLPLSILAIIIGSCFGLQTEILLSATAGTGMGAWFSFILSRHWFRRPLEKWVSKRISVSQLDRAIAERNWLFVLLIRLSPVAPFSFVSYAFGLTRIRLVDFLLGTTGSLPALIVYMYSGSLSRGVFSALISQSAGPRWLKISLFMLGIISTVGAVVVMGRIVKNVFGASLPIELEQKRLTITRQKTLRNRSTEVDGD